MKKIKLEDMSLDNLNFMKKKLSKIQSENKFENKFGMGIIAGLIMGLIGNFYVTILYDYVIKDFSGPVKMFLFLIATLLIIIVIRLTLLEDRDYKKINSRLEMEITEILAEIDRRCLKNK